MDKHSKSNPAPDGPNGSPSPLFRRKPAEAGNQASPSKKPLPPAGNGLVGGSPSAPAESSPPMEDPDWRVLGGQDEWKEDE